MTTTIKQIIGTLFADLTDALTYVSISPDRATILQARDLARDAITLMEKETETEEIPSKDFAVLVSARQIRTHRNESTKHKAVWELSPDEVLTVDVEPLKIYFIYGVPPTTNKIIAIKSVRNRNANAMGLKDAKDYVENLSIQPVVSGFNY